MKILGIDHGDARIGLALSDDLGMMAHPLETVDARVAPDALLGKIAAVVTGKGVERVVLGLPRNMDGSYGPAAAKVRQFGAALQARIGDIKVIFWDERMTTRQAQRSLHDAGRNTKNSRKVIDQVAAVIILQNYLDAQAGTADF
ncbi:MAG TPA: Holliday junction resolvase RuvX [Chthoniobacterales bacterium]